MTNKLKALLIGGPENGETVEVNEAQPELSFGYRVLERNGEWRFTATSTYKLQSKEPLHYEFSN